MDFCSCFKPTAKSQNPSQSLKPEPQPAPSAPARILRKNTDLLSRQLSKTEENDINHKNINLIKNGSVIGGLDKQQVVDPPYISNNQNKSNNEDVQDKLHQDLVDMNQIKLLSLSPQRELNRPTPMRKRQFVNHTIEFLSGMAQMSSFIEFSATKKAAKNVFSIYARDYLAMAENETIVISKILRYMCALCSKIF